MPTISKQDAQTRRAAGSASSAALPRSTATPSPSRATREDDDYAPLVKGLPGDRCQSPHWGLLIERQAHLPLRGRGRRDHRRRGLLRPPRPHRLAGSRHRTGEVQPDRPLAGPSGLPGRTWRPCGRRPKGQRPAPGRRPLRSRQHRHEPSAEALSRRSATPPGAMRRSGEPRRGHQWPQRPPPPDRRGALRSPGQAGGQRRADEHADTVAGHPGAHQHPPVARLPAEVEKLCSTGVSEPVPAADQRQTQPDQPQAGGQPER